MYLNLPWQGTITGLEVQAALHMCTFCLSGFDLHVHSPGSCAVQEVVDALERYLCSGERRSMQWIPPQGPVRLQRLVMSARKDRQGLPHPNCLHLSLALLCRSALLALTLLSMLIACFCGSQLLDT